MADATEHNGLGQPVGRSLVWTPAQAPERMVLQGRCCNLEPLSRQLHAQDLFEANALDIGGGMWTYLTHGPFPNFTEFSTWLATLGDNPDLLTLAIIDGRTGKAVGSASYMRMDRAMGCIEVGHLVFSPLLQRSTAATEAMYLMMDQVFRLGFRRYEWKCNSLNAPSCRAAVRLGFTFEGIFRQAAISKGRNRDTAWYSLIDEDWPQVRGAFQHWLDPKNFDAQGQQRVSLSELMMNRAR